MLQFSRWPPMTSFLDPRPFTQPAGTHWCIPVSLALLAQAHGVQLTHEQIIDEYLRDKGRPDLRAKDVRTDDDLYRLTNTRFGPDFVTTLRRLCKDRLAIRDSSIDAGDTRQTVVARMWGLLQGGASVLTSLRFSPQTVLGCLAATIHIVPWIGYSPFPETFIAWEPVNGLCLSGTGQDVKAALMTDLWHCWGEPAPSQPGAGP